MFICGSVHAQDEDVVRVKSNLVNIDVIIKDKKGKYVSDLKPEDFVITENGLPQKIEFFDAPLSKTDTVSPGVTVVEAPTTTTPPTTAPRNYISLVLDSQTTDLSNLKQVREGAIRYVNEQLTSGDVVAILSVTNSLRMLQPFTQDKSKLIAALENLGTSGDSKNSESREIAETIARLRDTFFDFVLTDIETQPAPHLTFAQYLRLTGLAPGRYQAMIETKDMVTRKSTKQAAPFEIVP